MTGEFKNFMTQLQSVKYPKARLRFMTAHIRRSGYDNVIIINMLETRFGFPSQIEADPILKMVTYEDISVPFAEERRLFYVLLPERKIEFILRLPC